MRRGTLLCTIVVLAAVVGMPGVASAGGGCHGGVTQTDATGQEDATVQLVDACFLGDGHERGSGDARDLREHGRVRP